MYQYTRLEAGSRRGDQDDYTSLAGLDETGNRGAAAKYGPADQKRILAVLDQPAPQGYSNWTAPLLARALGDVHEQYIWRFLRAQKIDLSGRKS